MPKRPDSNASLAAHARQAHGLRNDTGTMARDLMTDRKGDAHLTRDYPNLSWDKTVSKTCGGGFQGDNVFREIISSPQRSKASIKEN